MTYAIMKAKSTKIDKLTYETNIINMLPYVE
jgi:hypothetical protein